ncbi:hypothetical protein Tco_1053222 [Tanacetum coccineum]
MGNGLRCVLTTILEDSEQVETPDNPFIAPVNIKIIESIMNRVSYQGVVDKYPRFTKLIIVDLMKKFPSISSRLEEDYHSIKDDIPLIRATNDYKEYKMVFVGVDVLMNKPQPIVSTQGTHKTTPKAHKTPTLTTATLLSLTMHKTTLVVEAQENVAKVQEKLAEEEIEKIVEGEEDKESYVSVFADSMLNDDVDDSDDDEKNDENVKKTDDFAKEKNNNETGSMETRNKQMQTPIPSPNRSLKKDLSSDKTISEELTTIVSPKIATTSKYSSKSNGKKGFTSNKTKLFQEALLTHEFFMGKIREVLDHCNNVVHEITFERQMR